MNSRLLIMSFLVLAMASCEQKPETAQITFKVDARVAPEIVLSNAVDMKYDTIKSINNAVLEREVASDGEFVTITAGRQKRLLYINPGSDVSISSAERGRLVISGTGQKERDFLKEFDKQYSIASTKYGLSNIASLEKSEFLSNLKEKYESLNQIIENGRSEGIADGLLSKLEARISASRASDIYGYPLYYEFLNKKEIDLDESFYQYAQDFDINDPNIFYFPEMKDASVQIATRDINFSDYAEIDHFVRAQLESIERNVSDSEVKEILKYYVFSDKINLGAGEGGLGKEIDNYLSTIKDQQKKANILADLAKWAHLQEGQVAPSFSAYTRDGEEVKLSDLRGKNVYIDVWATWCGPCIMEIPSLKAMEEKYEDENIEFVSVSIDEAKDQEKWRNMVVNKELGGTQVMARNAWQSDLVTSYNIMSIPRFILIDKDGTIVSADAPRPSNKKKLENLFEQILN